MLPQRKQRIAFSQGFWWYHHPKRNLVIKLDPLFAKCGWSVGSLCILIGAEKRTFARVVEESIGITGKAWLCRLRAVAAGHLLREGDEITFVADQLGFRHNSDFASEFKKQVGVSPSSYVNGVQH